MAPGEPFWHSIINDFNPVGQIRPEDVARFYVDRKEDKPTRSLLQRLKLSLETRRKQPKPYKALVTGHIGSGKSSELICLGQKLADQFFVVWFDAESSLTTDKANHFDVLLGMGLAVHAAAEVAGLRPDEQRADDLLDSLSKFVQTHEQRAESALKLHDLIRQVFAFVLVGTGGALGGVPGALLAGAAVGINTVLKATRIELNVDDKFIKTLELPANRQAVIGALNQIIEDVQDKAKKRVLIIVDGLDKIMAVRAKLLFADSTLLTEPACALIYAAPIEFYHRIGAKQATNLFDGYEMLPNPPVQKRPLTRDNWNKEREPCEDGLKVMRKVVTKRLESQGHAVDRIITSEALELLARKSGGVMRELIRSFNQAATFAQLLGQKQIDAAIAQDVVNQELQDMQLRLKATHLEALRRILKEGTLIGGQLEATEDELLHSLHLLSYKDDGVTSWVDAHPNVFPLL